MIGLQYKFVAKNYCNYLIYIIFQRVVIFFKKHGLRIIEQKIAFQY